MKTTYPVTLMCDFYKISHRAQYPVDTEVVYSTWKFTKQPDWW